MTIIKNNEVLFAYIICKIKDIVCFSNRWHDNEELSARRAQHLGSAFVVSAHVPGDSLSIQTTDLGKKPLWMLEAR